MRLVMRSVADAIVVAVAGVVFASGAAHAVSLSLVPSSTNAQPGDSVTLDLVISGLGDFAPDSLGDFDIDIAFDPSVVSFTSYTLGSYLGDVSLFEALDSSLGDLGGIVNLSEVSLLLLLDDIQPGAFTLAALEFSVGGGLTPGTSTTVSIDTVWALGDAFGDPLTVDSLSDATISNPGGALVPEPGAHVLFAVGALIASGALRRRGSPWRRRHDDAHERRLAS